MPVLGSVDVSYPCDNCFRVAPRRVCRVEELLGVSGFLKHKRSRSLACVICIFFSLI
jgi:hypothetical protein